MVGGEVGKEAEGVGGKVDISGVHRHSQQEHCNDDYTHTHTHAHTHTCTHTHTHAHREGEREESIRLTTTTAMQKRSACTK